MAIDVGLLTAVLARPLHPDYGDVPTWLAFAAASGAAWIALRQLRDQRDVIDRQTHALERQQADRVDVTGWNAHEALVLGNTDVPDGPALAVENKSTRPIREIRCQFWNGEGPGRPHSAAGAARWQNDATVRLLINEPTSQEQLDVIRAGGLAAFLWVPLADSDLRYAVRFRDDAGINWQIDRLLHLERLGNSPDW